MIYVVYTIHVVVCLFLILVVLLQQGKGADLSVFGGGSTQSAFGARGAATLLHKLTVAGFVAFIVTTIAIGFLQGHRGGGSVMSTVGEEAAPASEPVESQPVSSEEKPAPDQPAADPAAATGEGSATVDGNNNDGSEPPTPQ